MVKRHGGGKAMHDEQVMYRVQWPTLYQHLHRLCLGQHKTVLLDALCNGCEPCEEHRVKTTVHAWQQAILDELTQYTRAPDAWPGWEALIPLFGDTERLCRDIGQAAPTICHAYARGDTSIVWNVLRTYFTDMRDSLDGARKTRLPVWRRLDRLRHAFNRQRRHQGLPDCHDLPELVAHILAVIETQGWKDAPTTMEGVWSYFVEFDPVYARPYDEDIHSLGALQDLTNKDWQLDLTRCLEQLPADLRQAVEVQYELRPHPVCRTDEDYRQHYGCSARTVRDRAAKAVQQLRQMLSL
jgi:DNA-directed RNA polymerase specialized sigma24 family protein